MHPEYPFQIAFLFVFMAIVGIRLYYRGFADATSGVRETTKDEGSFRFVRVLLGGPLIVAFLCYMIWPPLLQWSQFPLTPMTRWVGMVFLILTIAMLLWVHKHLAQNFTGTVQIRPHGHLVHTGPYAYVRHPMYIAFILLSIGTLLLTANWFLGGGLLLIFSIVIIVRTPIEERALEKAYGEEYRRYKQTTGALWPKLRS